MIIGETSIRKVFDIEPFKQTKERFNVYSVYKPNVINFADNYFKDTSRGYNQDSILFDNFFYDLCKNPIRKSDVYIFNVRNESWCLYRNAFGMYYKADDKKTIDLYSFGEVSLYTEELIHVYGINHDGTDLFSSEHNKLSIININDLEY